MTRRVDRLVFLPVAGALLVMWGTLGTYTVFEKNIILERAQSQLGLTVSTLGAGIRVARSGRMTSAVAQASRMTLRAGAASSGWSLGRRSVVSPDRALRIVVAVTRLRPACLLR
jgi:hypothetical protein